MEENVLIDKLILFGLTRQEASIYLCFLLRGELSGYEAAKQTGISRSNVYSAIAGLTGKGAIYLLEGSTSRYMAVPIDELCGNYIRHLTKEQAYLVQNMPIAADIPEGYITIVGFRHIMDKIHHMLLHAEKRIYLSASSVFIDSLKTEIAALVQKEIKIVLITDKNELPIYEDTIKLYVRSDKAVYGNQQQIRLIIDSAYVLTGELTGGNTDTCLYCTQKNFVNVFKEAMHNEIKLIEIQTNSERKHKGEGI